MKSLVAILFSFTLLPSLLADEVVVYKSSGHYSGDKSFTLKASTKKGIEYNKKGCVTQRIDTKESKALADDVIKKLQTLKLTKKELIAEDTLHITSGVYYTIIVTKGAEIIKYSFRRRFSLELYTEEYYLYLDQHLKTNPNNFLSATERDVKSLYEKHQKTVDLIIILINKVQDKMQP